MTKYIREAVKLSIRLEIDRPTMNTKCIFNYMAKQFDYPVLKDYIIDDVKRAEITIGGTDKKWTKGENEQWIEEEAASNTTPEFHKKKWWEFWK